MVNLYALVGEHVHDLDRYLVLGEDGSYYEWDLVTEQTIPIEPGEDWVIDSHMPTNSVVFDDLFLDDVVLQP